MLYLFTDYGWQGPYIGQMKSTVATYAHHCQVVDLMHDAPIFNVKASAYLLAAVVKHLPQDCVVAAIVDPKVGSVQKGLVLRADYRWYVAPDNGLLDVVARQARSCHWYEITYSPKNISHSFHGRDIYVPVASKLIVQDSYESLFKPISAPKSYFPDHDLNEIVYIDHFGNLMTGIRAKTDRKLKSLKFANQQLARFNTFADVKPGNAFFYENSQGLLEIAINSGNAQEYFSANIGDRLEVEYIDVDDREEVVS